MARRVTRPTEYACHPTEYRRRVETVRGRRVAQVLPADRIRVRPVAALLPVLPNHKLLRHLRQLKHLTTAQQGAARTMEPRATYLTESACHPTEYRRRVETVRSQRIHPKPRIQLLQQRRYRTVLWFPAPMALSKPATFQPEERVIHPSTEQRSHVTLAPAGPASKQPAR